MVRFLCFNAHVQPHRLRKSVEPSVEAMSKSLQDPSQIQAPKNTTMKLSILNSDSQTTGSANDVRRSLSIEGKLQSEEIKGKSSIESGKSAHQTRIMKTSQSLGGGLCHEGRILLDNDTEDDVGQGFSGYSLYQNGLAGMDGRKDQQVSPTCECQKNDSIFSIGDPRLSDKPSPENFDAILSGDFLYQNGLAGVDGSKDQWVSPTSECQKNDFIFTIGDPQRSVKSSPENFDPILFGEVDCSPPMTIKPYSMPTLGLSTSSGQCSCNYFQPCSRSSEDLHVLSIRRKEISVHEVEKEVMGGHGRDDCMCKTEKNNHETSLDDDHASCNYSAFTKDRIIPVLDEMNLEKNVQGESFIQQRDEASKNFKIKRIEEWVIDLQHCSPLEETNELPDVNSLMKRDSSLLNDLNVAKVDVKITSGTEAAKRYISTLSYFSTTVQLSNHGLAVIPFLGAFVCLKMLNLSGNSIARITAGALPRGLHVLNLSKNNISTIEGLRDLSRLRVLDLSYNRIMRIAHSLASCSSLKELYLAGNKICQVEGLHRLLKLTVLDLRFNKISTAKCLGQLAANYKSLQAISLEGNPAQKNVGDEQLKKYLLGLLPHLVYFNRQPVKGSTLKHAAERSVRLGISTFQFDRDLRSDNKVVRKAGHGLDGWRPSSSLAHGRNNPAVTSTKRSRDRHILLPQLELKQKPVTADRTIMVLAAEFSILNQNSPCTEVEVRELLRLCETFCSASVWLVSGRYSTLKFDSFVCLIRI